MQLLKKDGVNTQIITKGYFVGLTTLIMFFMLSLSLRKMQKQKQIITKGS